jgi:hypothetical protein
MCSSHGNAEISRRRGFESHALGYTSRANTIIVAARQYEAQHGRLPDRLDELVPAFIASIPSTNYTLTFNKFMYLTPPGRHVLMWGMFQFGGRPYYDFENHRWGVFPD